MGSPLSPMSGPAVHTYAISSEAGVPSWVVASVAIFGFSDTALDEVIAGGVDLPII